MKLISTFLLLLLLLPVSVMGQSATKIKGKITDTNGNPLPGATVLIKSLNIGTATDVNGAYSFEVPAAQSNGQTVSLTARYVGYKEKSTNITLSGGEVTEDFSLAEDVFESEEVVVTGIANRTSKGVAEVSVSRLDAVGYTNSNSYQSISQLIGGKVSGVQMTPSSGNVGGGFSFYMRGGGGINGDEQPIIYIDGVRVDNSQTSFFGVGGQSTSALASLNPDDIAKIEILKGPAGAAMYGTQGSNGVILITTKSGSAIAGGKGLTVDYKYTYGYNNQSFKYSTDYFKSATDANANFIKGYIREHIVNLSGGSSALRYYGSFTSRNEGGIMPNNNLNRKSVRANITAYPNEKFTIKLNSTFNYADISRPQNDNNIYGFLGNTLLFPPPSYRFTDSLSIIGLQNIAREDQFVGSVDILYTPIENLQIQANAGVDNSNIREDETFPSNLRYAFRPAGERDLSNRENKQFTYTLTGRYNFSLLDDQLRITSIAGAQLFNRSLKTNFLQTRTFATELITDIGSGIDVVGYGEGFFNSRTAGIFTEHSFAYMDKYFLTLGLRRDYASTIGIDAPSTYYPKASFAVRLDRFDILPKSIFNLLKLRAAYGETGELPGLLDGIPLFWTASVGGYGAGGILSSIGNPKIKPERIRELEVGFDAELLNIFSVEFTYYQQRAANSIVGFNNPPSTGLTVTPVPFNVGGIKNHGFESLVQADLFRSTDYDLNLAMIWNYQTNEVTDLGGAQPIFDAFSQNVIKPGLPKHEYYLPVVTGAKFDNTGKYIGPNVTPDRKDLGNPIANWTGSFTVNFRFLKNFNLYALFDWALDRKMMNETSRFAARFGNYVPLINAQTRLKNATIGTQEYIDAANAVAKLDGNYVSNYLEQARFIKFRELSISYSFRDILKDYLSANYISDLIIGFSGRNLWTKTPYTGSDIELNARGSRDLTRGWDFLTIQNPRVYNVWVRVAF